MDWKKGIGYGLAIWVVMFVLVSALIAFKVYDIKIVHYLAGLVAPILAYIFAGYIKPSDASKAIGYGIIFVAVVLIFDWLITTRFNADIFSSRTLWVSYGLTLSAPLLQAKKTQ